MTFVPITKPAAFHLPILPSQACGTAAFTDDLPVARHALYAAFVVSTVPKGAVASIDTSAALQVGSCGCSCGHV